MSFTKQELHANWMTNPSPNLLKRREGLQHNESTVNEANEVCNLLELFGVSDAQEEEIRKVSGKFDEYIKSSGNDPMGVVIAGLPGMGKSTLAQKLIDYSRQKSSQDWTHVLWIPAHDTTCIRKAFFEASEAIDRGLYSINDVLTFNLPKRTDVKEIEMPENFLDLKVDHQSLDGANSIVQGKQVHDKVFMSTFYQRLCHRQSIIIFDNASCVDKIYGLEEGIRDFLCGFLQPWMYQPFYVVTTRTASHAVWKNLGDVTYIKLGWNFGHSIQTSTRGGYTFKWMETESCERTICLDMLFCSLRQIIRKKESEDEVSQVEHVKLQNLWDPSLLKLRFVPDHGILADKVLNVITILSTKGVPEKFLTMVLSSYLKPLCIVETSFKPKLKAALHLLQVFSLIEKQEKYYFINPILQKYRRLELRQSNELENLVLNLSRIISLLKLHNGWLIPSDRRIEQVFNTEGRNIGKEPPTCFSPTNEIPSIGPRLDKLTQELRVSMDINAMQSKILGPEHPDTIDSKNKIAELRTIKFMDQILDQTRIILVPERPDTISIRNLFRDDSKDEDTMAMFNKFSSVMNVAETFEQQKLGAAASIKASQRRPKKRNIFKALSERGEESLCITSEPEHAQTIGQRVKLRKRASGTPFNCN